MKVFFRELGGDFGLQRIWATVAAIIGGPLAGFLLDYGGMETSKFFSVFLLFFCLRVLSSLLILQLDLTFKKKSTEVLKYLRELIFDPNILSFLLTFCLLGAVWGFLETFLFLFLAELGLSRADMGLSLSIGTVAGTQLHRYCRYSTHNPVWTSTGEIWPGSSHHLHLPRLHHPPVWVSTIFSSWNYSNLWGIL